MCTKGNLFSTATVSQACKSGQLNYWLADQRAVRQIMASDFAQSSSINAKTTDLRVTFKGRILSEDFGDGFNLLADRDSRALLGLQ